MKIGIRSGLALLLFAPLLLIATGARADEIRLKDGSKIIGTIVGYEDDSFKVQTSYGFAMVRKDQIAEIIPSPPKPAPKPKESPAAPKGKDSSSGAPDASASSPNAAPAPSLAPTDSPPDVSAATISVPPPDSPIVSAAPAPAVAPPVASAPPAHTAPAKPAARPAAVAANRHNIAPTPAAAPVASASPAAPAPAPDAPAAAPAAAIDTPSPPMREEIVGNLYINRTFAFDIYKPPDWELLPDEMHSLPNVVTAMGTDDSTTLLLIGREARKGALDAQAAATDAQLRNIYDNFRLISSAQASIAGEPAIERHFRGSAADRDRSVTVVTVAHGPNLFTVLGMTYADSDLIQIQENVIARAISSMRFEAP
jgi:hypothetical protein